LSDPACVELFGRRSATGLPINSFSALGVPAFYRAVDLISSTIARISCPVYREGADDSRNVYDKHPSNRFLTFRANDTQSAFDFKKQLSANAVWAGNAFAAIKRDPLGNPTGLYNLDPASTGIELRYDPGDPELKAFRVWSFIYGARAVFDYYDVIHIRGLGNTNGLLGLDLIDLCRDTLGLAQATTAYGAHFFGNSCQPTGAVFKMTNPGGDEKIADFAAQLKEQLQGVHNAGNGLLIPFGIDKVDTVTDNRKNQWADTQDIIAKAVSNITGIPPHLLGVSGTSSYSSLEQENLSLLNNVFDPWFRRMEEEFTAKLLTEDEKNSGKVFVVFNRDELTRSDATATTETLLDELNAGTLTQNEYRRIKLRPTTGPNGDRFRIRTDTTFQDMPAYDPDAVKEQQAQANQAKADATAALQQQPQAPAQEPDKAEKVLKASVDRFFIRLEKSINAKRGETFGDWVTHGLASDHFHIFSDILRNATDRHTEIAEQFFDELKDELSAISQADLDMAITYHKEHTAQRITREALA